VDNEKARYRMTLKIKDRACHLDGNSFHKVVLYTWSYCAVGFPDNVGFPDYLSSRPTSPE
jgi:hypothetical protein